MKIPLLDRAKSILQQNWNGQFTMPTSSRCSTQWTWDAAFTAMGYAHYDFEKAKAEFHSLFRGQWKNGMIPQMVFHTNEGVKNPYFPSADFWQSNCCSNAPTTIFTSGITTPPIYGYILLNIYQENKDQEGALDFLKEMYPKVVAFHRYLYTHRDPQEEGLIYVHHPWELAADSIISCDNNFPKIEETKIPLFNKKDIKQFKTTPSKLNGQKYKYYNYLVDIFRKANYDEKLIFEKSPYLIQDPFFNSILVQSNEALVKIAKLINVNKDISDLISWNEYTIHSINEKLWNEETARYDAWDLCTHKKLPTHTTSAMMPLFAGIPDLPRAEYMVGEIIGNFANNATENQSFPFSNHLVNVDLKKRKAEPIWVNVNWLLYKGLTNYLFVPEAEQIKESTLNLISQQGFYESFQQGLTTSPTCSGKSCSRTAALYIDFVLDVNS